jgi:hypothetical protein
VVSPAGWDRTHHKAAAARTPRRVPYHQRAAAEVIGEIRQIARVPASHAFTQATALCKAAVFAQRYGVRGDAETRYATIAPRHGGTAQVANAAVKAMLAAHAEVKRAPHFSQVIRSRVPVRRRSCQVPSRSATRTASRGAAAAARSRTASGAIRCP